MLQAVRNSGGWGETATDEEIVEAIQLLAEMEGIFTEPAGGATLAVTMKLIKQKKINPQGSIVVGITGNGYKALDTLQSDSEIRALLRPNLKIFREWYEGQTAVPSGAA